MYRFQASAMIALTLLAATALPPLARAASFEVTVSGGSRETAAGDVVDYLLFVPAPANALPEPPFPAVILTHGFARDYGRHVGTALFLASDLARPITGQSLAVNGGKWFLN